MEHPAYRGDQSKVQNFVLAKQKNAAYDLYPKESYVWLKEPELEFVPAKVTVAFEALEGGGQVAIEHEGKVELRDVDAAQAKCVVGMDERYLVPQRFVHPLSYDLSLPALLHNARTRFQNDQDFYMIGADSLLYINRFEDEDYRLEKITREMMAKLESDDDEDDDDMFVLPEPSVEQFAETAFEALNASNGRESQSCLFFGSLQSGAHLRNQDYIRKIVQLANPNDVTWWDKLLAGYVILRAFGGTKFIPWTEMHFAFSGKQSTGSLVGAAFDNFLLDVSNLTNRNGIAFDCFYQLCGASQVKHEQIEQQFEVHHKEVYAYMNANPSTAEEPFVVKTCRRAGCSRHCYALTDFCETHADQLKKCAEEGCEQEEVGDGHCYEHGNKDVKSVLGATRTWAETLAAFDRLGVSDYESKEVIQLLADILRFGNVDILKHREFGMEPYEGRLVYDSNPVFGLELDFLVDELAEKEIRVGSDVIVKTRSSIEANALRDALSKTLYTALFGWLTKIINRGVTYTRAAKQKAFRVFTGKRAEKERVGVIGTLCTQGLVFDLKESSTHALEKLVNNYNQERLYELFADQEMKSSVDYWVSGGLKIAVKKEVNPVFTLILNKEAVFESDFATKRGGNIQRNVSKRFAVQKRKHKLGILEILDDEMVRPGGSDKALIAKIERIHEGNPSLLPAYKKGAFTVRHYGGPVTYDVDGFVQDTRSNVLPDAVFQAVLEHTTDSFIVKLLTQHNPKQTQIFLDKLHSKQVSKGNVRGESGKSFNSLPSGVTRARSTSTTSTSRRGGGMLQLFTIAPPRLLKGGIKRSKSSRSRKRMPEVQSENGPVEPIHRGSILTFDTKSRSAFDAHDFHVGKFLQERSTIVQNSVSVLLEMLRNTNSRFVHCFESNRLGAFEEGFDSAWMLEQLKTTGLGQLYSQRLSNLSYGLGHSSREFLQKYWMISPRKCASAKEWCQSLTVTGLIPKDSWRIGKNDRVFVLGSVVDMLKRVKVLAREDMAVFIQKYVRGYLAQLRYRDLMIEHIEARLEVAIEKSDLDALEELVELSKLWDHRPQEITTVLGKIERLKREKVMDAKLLEAVANRDSLKLYEYIQEAGKMGMAHSAAFQEAIRVNGEIEVERERLHEAGREDFRIKFEGVITELAEEQEFNRHFDVDEFIAKLKEKVAEDNIGGEGGEGGESSVREGTTEDKEEGLEDKEEVEEDEDEDQEGEGEEHKEEDDETVLIEESEATVLTQQVENTNASVEAQL